MQLRLDQAAFQREKSREYWIEVKFFQRRNASLDPEIALRGFWKQNLEIYYHKPHSAFHYVMIVLFIM